jgi:hypothetical protein
MHKVWKWMKSHLKESLFSEGTLQKKRTILRGFLSYFAAVSNLRRLFCGSYKNCRLIDSHKLFAGVLVDRWYLDNNPRKMAAVLFRRFKTPAK